MTAVTNALAGTPVWVWVLLAFLIFIGVRSLKPSSASFGRLAVLPVVFLVWGIASLVATFAVSPISLGAWAAAFAAGIGLGRLLIAPVAVRADKTRGLLQLPGSWVNLAMILLIFSTKYVFGYLVATRPGLIRDPGFVVINLGLSGLLVGILVGRFWGLWEKYRAAPHEELATA